MGIKTKETGEEFIVAPKVRSRRTRYEKTPLGQVRVGLVDWFKQLFAPRKRPFRASAIADHIDRGIPFSQQVPEDAPAKLLASGSVLIESVGTQLQQYSVEASTRADNALDEIDDNLRQEAAWLDQCRPEGIVNALETKLRDQLVDLSTSLLPLARNLIAMRVALEQFRQRNRLSEDIPAGKHLDAAVIGQIGIILAIEFVANAVVQSDTQKAGLLGGLTFAALASLATILIGMLFGLGYQRTHKSAQGGGWIGFSLMGAALVATFIFVSCLSLIRVAGEAGDMHSVETARLEMIADPFAGVRAMLDLPAFAYTICIIGLIVSVARKFLAYAGAFPGYRKHALQYQDATDDLEGEYEAFVDEANEIVEDMNHKLDRAPDFIASCKVPIQTLVADHENVLDQFENDTGDIRSAARLFDSFIRQRREEDEQPVTVLRQETASHLTDYADKLRNRHQSFNAKADELCARDDVSDATIAAARLRFTELMEGSFEALADRKRVILEAALTDYKKDKDWLADVLTPTATLAVAQVAAAE